MKLLFVISDLRMGGAEKLNFELVKELSKNAANKIKLVLFMNNSAFDLSELNKTNVEIIGLNNLNNINIFNGISKLSKIIKNFKPDFIISSNSRPYIISAIAGFFTATKTILWEHSIISNHINFFTKPLVKLAYSLSNAVIAPSALCKSDIIKTLGVPKNKITTIYNFASINTMSKNQDYSPIIDKACTSIISIGNLTEKKDYFTAIKAMKLLVDKKQNFKYYIIGSGYLEKDLKYYVQKLSLENNVFLLGPIKNPAYLLKQADIYLNSSTSECMPLSIIEGMMAGLPVVACKNSGAKEVLGDGKYALLAEISDSYGLSQNLQIFIEDKSKREEYAQKALERSKIFSLDNFIKNFSMFLSNK